MGEEGAGPPSAGDAGSEPGGAEEAWTHLSVREHGAVAGGRAREGTGTLPSHASASACGRARRREGPQAPAAVSGGRARRHHHWQ